MDHVAARVATNADIPALVEFFSQPSFLQFEIREPNTDAASFGSSDDCLDEFQDAYSNYEEDAVQLDEPVQSRSRTC